MNDYLDRLEAQLTQLTEHGAHQRLRARGVAPVRRRAGAPRPPRRGSEALAFLAAAAVVAAVVAIVLVNAHGNKPQRTSASAGHSTTVTKPKPPSGIKPPPPQTHTGTVAAPLPSHFAPQSFTAISELTWWLLGSGPSIVRTTDGGRTFRGVPAPRAPLSNDGTAPGYSQLRFADAQNGFAYGPDLYVTHDGGQTWQQMHFSDVKVTDLAISAGIVYVTVEPTHGGHGWLMRSPVSRTDWTNVTAAGAVSGGLWVQGSDLIVQSGVGIGIGGNVLVSHDRGQTFTAYPAPSPGLPCLFAAPAPPVVWARCATGTESGVWRSTDGGAHFTAVVSSGLRLPNTAAFAAASASTAVVGAERLYRTTDDGATWAPVGPTGIAQWAYLGFTDPTHGVALGYAGSVAPTNERLYYTTDGGQTYHLVPLP